MAIIQKFEAQCTATNHNKKIWRDILRGATDSDPFTALASEIAAYNYIPHVNLKTNIATKYCGESYKGHLEMNLNNIKIRSGTKAIEYLII